jgi:hypothetical protein
MFTTKKNLQIWYRAYTKSILASTGFMLLGLMVILWLVFHPVHSPVPPNIKKEANFSIIYPDGYTIQPTSWKYSGSSGSLAFSAQEDNATVAFTEQQVPLAFQNDVAAYNRFIGGLKPLAIFTAPLGTVSLVEFVTSGDFTPEGETGILNADGTFLLMHPNQQLTEDQWRSLSNSLRLSL